jgi:hypothetical protein
MKIPVFFPVTREFGFRDEFAQDCFLQRRVREPSVPLETGRPRLSGPLAVQVEVLIFHLSRRSDGHLNYAAGFLR